MTVLDDLKSAKLRAMKRKDGFTSDLLGLVIGQIQQGNDSSDDAVFRACQKVIKSNNDTIKALQQDADGRDGSSRLRRGEMIASLQNENGILESFLPRSWTEDEIRNLISTKALDIIGAPSEGAAIGVVTKALRETSKAPFDGKMVREIVSSLRRDAS